MGRREYGPELGFATRAIHAGNDVDGETGAIKRPLTMGNAYALPHDPSALNWSSPDGPLLYTRNGGANQRYLQERLASLEGTEDAIAFASGVGALSGTFLSLLKSGDHAVFPDVTYVAVYRLLNEILPQRFNIETTIVDTRDPHNVEAAIRPNTKLVHIETPGNPTLGISDIAAIAKIAHNAGAVQSVDNTFASPFDQRPTDFGADLVIESLTKYINGHGDALGGSVAGPKELLDPIRELAQVNLGATISPFNAWLIMRGSVTLPLRMRQHNENGLAVAKFLDANDAVSFVAYPGLPGHRNHDVAARQMTGGFGGMLSFGLRADHETCNEFVDQLRVITSAVSLGHDESLIVFLGEDDERQYLYPKEFHRGFFRFSVGLEDVQDIIGDLQQALEHVGLA